jgi:hypothetical protein
MSSRVREKRRRREERERREQELAVTEKRARRRALLLPLAIGVVAAAGIGVAALRGGGTDSSPRSSSVAAANAPFGQHYDGLVQRREAAGVPTMMQTMGSTAHFHPRLQVFANGKQVPVPVNIGIDPRADDMQMAGLHTHEPNGTVHVEGMASATLGQFLAVWGVPFSAARLGPHKAHGDAKVRMWVDGKPSHAFGALRLADGQRIVVSYGTLRQPPAA